MAVLTGGTVLYQSPPSQGAARVALVAFPNVTAADTFDAATLPTPFVTVTAALAVALSGPAVTTTLATIASNTVISAVGAGMARNSVVFFIVGE